MRKSALLLIIISALLFAGCKAPRQRAPRPDGPPKSDVDFAREVFQRMGDGDLDVAQLLDWENLTMAGVDVGAQYRNVSGDSGREIFQDSFLKGYSKSFKSAGGNTSALNNWREQSKDSTNTVVAGDLPNGQTLLITVTHTNGLQYVSSVQAK
jgi:hypothetical protein